MSFENPLGNNPSSESVDNPRAKLEHSRDLFDLKLLQLARISAEAEGKALEDEDLKRMRELMTRVSREELLDILDYARTTVKKNKANQKPSEAAESFTVCKNCGTQVKKGSFCSSCGKPIEEPKRPGASILEADKNKFFCLGCGKLAKPGKFCENCGTRIFNGAEMALFRTMNIKPQYLLEHPDEALGILKTERNMYIKKNRQVENKLEQYNNEAEVKEILDIYGKLVEKYS